VIEKAYENEQTNKVKNLILEIQPKELPRNYVTKFDNKRIHIGL